MAGSTEPTPERRATCPGGPAATAFQGKHRSAPRSRAHASAGGYDRIDFYTPAHPGTRRAVKEIPERKIQYRGQRRLEIDLGSTHFPARRGLPGNQFLPDRPVLEFAKRGD